MKKCPLEHLRKLNERNGRYVYKLVVDKKELWLNTRELEEREEAVITRKAISLRLNHMFKRQNGSTFKTVLDCISRVPEKRVKFDLDIDVNDAFKLMNKSLMNRT